MLGQLYIPKEVKDNIKKHLQEAIKRAKETYSSAYEDEDVMTGVLFGLLQIGTQTVHVNDSEIGGDWKWSINFNKFGGRGKGATESLLGADGIFEISVNRNGRVEKKALLFQSKLGWLGTDKKLYYQSARLINWLGAVTIINYTDTDFETFRVEDVFSQHGKKPPVKSSLEDTLGNEFLNCDIGDADLHYDMVRKKLIWLDENNQMISTQFNINRKLKFEIKAPNKFPFEKITIDKEIENVDILNHRLKNEYSSFNIDSIFDNKELKKIQRDVSTNFHPDKHMELPEREKNMLNDMMKNLNHKFDLQKDKIRKRKNE